MTSPEMTSGRTGEQAHQALPVFGVRTRFALALALALIAALIAGCAQYRTTEPALQAWGYAAWWLPLKESQLQSAPVDRLLFFEIALGTDGSIANAHGWPDAHEDLRNAAAKRNTPLDLVLTVHGAQPFQALFSDAQARARLLDSALSLASDPAVSGLQLDAEVYESVSVESIAGMREWVAQLAARLRAMQPRRELTLFIPPAHTGLYDRTTVSYADWGVMQAYDAHWANGPEAGPVAPLHGRSEASWERAFKHAQALGLPRHRTLLAYPLYGYEWPMRKRGIRGATAGAARITTLATIEPARLPSIQTSVEQRVAQYGCVRDARNGSAAYQFLDPDRGWVAGWYEGAWSLQHKRRFLIDKELAGVAFFVLGYDDFRLVDAFERRRHAPSQPVPKC